MVRSRNYIATPPGATIREQLLEREMSQKEFAARMAMSEKHISRLINGDVQLTPETAVRLEMVLGVPASFWTKLEAIYQEKMAKANAENAMDEDKELVKRFPYKEMVNNKWIESVPRLEDKVIALRKFFEVVSLSLVNQRNVSRIACRRSGESEKADYALLAWAQRAKIEARMMETGPINIKELIAMLPQIRSMTNKDPRDFCPDLIRLLSTCGVAITFLPHIGGSFLHGATFYDGNKIVIGLTVRGKDADKFWFSLFHEIGHIVLGHINQPDGTTEADEAAADQFARDTLIPQRLFDAFVSKGDFSKLSMIHFSDSIDIDVGIVVGRLQKEGLLQFNWHNDMKTKYELVG